MVTSKFTLTGSLNLSEPLPLVLFSVFIAAASNLFSNVPLTILVLAQLEPCVPQRALVLQLAWVATVAGNLTLFGSVANLIVAQQATRVADAWRLERRSRELTSNEVEFSQRAYIELEKYHLTFTRFLTFGPIATLAVCLVGIVFIRFVVLLVGW